MMGVPALALVVLIAAAASNAAVVTQQQAAPGYYLAHPVQPYLQGLYPGQVPNSYLYTPVVPVPPGSAINQDPKQQQQGLATVKATAGFEPYPEYYSDSNGRFLSTLLNPISSLNTLIAQLLNKGETQVATATIIRMDPTGATPLASQGTAVFFQKNSASNLNFFINIQYADATAGQFLTTVAVASWTADIRTNVIGTGTTRCTAATLGAVFPSTGGVLTTTATTVLPTTAAAGVQALSFVGSVAATQATLFGTNTINGHSVRIVAPATAIPNFETFCGNVVLQ